MLKPPSRVQAARRPFQDFDHIARHRDATSVQMHLHDHPLLVLSLQLLLQCCSFLQLWHPENGGNQRSEARGRLPEPQGANTRGLCVTLQLRFITIAKLNFPSQPADHTRVAPSYVMHPFAFELTRLIEGGTTKVGPACLHKVEMQKEV